MKYTTLEINKMSLLAYRALMADELNHNGFRTKIGNFKFDADDELFIFSVADSPKAMSFLQELGLVDNGRCPICGAQISENRYTWSNRYDPSIKFYICSGCYRSRGHGNGQRVDGIGNSGCLASLFLIPLNFIKDIIG